MNENDKHFTPSQLSSHIKKRHVEKTEKLSGLQKAAIFLISMGPKASSEIIKHLNDDEIQQLVSEIAQIKSVDKELKEKILKEFQNISINLSETSSGGEKIAKDILSKSFGDEKADEIMDRIKGNKPLSNLNKVDPERISMVLKDEHPQTIATVLAFLEPKISGQVLSYIPQEIKPDIIRRIAHLKNSNKDLLKTLEDSIINKLEKLPEKGEKSGGINAIVNILNSGLSEKTSKKIIENLEDTDSELADEIKKKLIKFEDVIFLLDKDVQKILSKVDNEIIAKSLKLANEEVKDKITSNISKRIYKEEIEPILSSGPMKVSEVEQSQTEIIKIMRELINSGEIFFSSEYIQ
jgi:flagellar motor switch protein FliG